MAALPYLIIVVERLDLLLSRPQQHTIRRELSRTRPILIDAPEAEPALRSERVEQLLGRISVINQTT